MIQTARMATTAATATLELREVHKSFGSVQALRGVDFEVREGTPTESDSYLQYFA